MLEKIREGSQGLTAKIILGLVILSFALAGIGSYLGQTTEKPVAVVNGQKISQTTFARAYENERSRLEQQFGEYFNQIASDPTYMARVREGVIDRLVQQELQTQLANELGLRISDEAIKEEIRTLPYFNIGGQFSNDRYLQVIRQMNFQPDTFRNYLRTEMTRSQLVTAVAASDFALPNEMVTISQLQTQVRDLDYVLLTADQVSKDITVTEQEISDYYTLNQSQFLSQEQVSVEYVELNAETLPVVKAVTDDEILALYNDNKAQYVEPERRRVAHILVDLGDDEAASEAKAQDLLAKLKAGADFAQLVQSDSSDIVSAENGGDLDWIDRDMMDPAFEEAAFSLAAKGDISDVVKSEFGFHIIKLTDLQAEQIKTLDMVKDELTARLEQDHKTEHFYELQTRLAELAFEVADSLSEAATAVEQEVKSTALFSRFDAPAPLNDAKVLDAAFSVELLEDKVNSELIELGNEHVVVLRVKEHKPAATKALAEVSDQIKAVLVKQKANEVNATRGDELYAKLSSGTSLADLAAEQSLQVEQARDIKRNAYNLVAGLAKDVFQMAHPVDKPVVNRITLANGDVALVSLLAVKNAPVTELDARTKESINAEQINRNYLVFVDALKQQAEVKAAAVEAVTE
ncbi:SurA N-terminal domain-containing protein [Pseudoalteromonas tunicata]|uniref:SurA N-terminal domain-containing protein n=1 Tax=Pseudoalteromonas tunicata TaxID=314281 RepID=UPI00273D8BF5|nr:SurA N-terminal domain-containing protein [Pseudoalteromonas tunicata]MDP5212964.1 SurA N-terminal domain-containing protein [Pseudoalteromonas tunicata]